MAKGRVGGKYRWEGEGEIQTREKINKKVEWRNPGGGRAIA